MQQEHIFAIDDFTKATSRLVIDANGIEGSPTADVEAALLTLPPVQEAIAANADWGQIVPLRRAVAATSGLLSTLTVVSDSNQAVVIEWALAWGEWLTSRLDAAKRYINDQARLADDES
jgi:hypothetical protein